ncbi:MAG: YheT family hydrolase [Bdellovibrio sp.]
MHLPDQDQVVLRVHEQDSEWVVLLCHGLTGSADSTYMHRITHQFLSSGLASVVRMNHRNCGEGQGLAKHPYHSGRSDDLGFAVAQVRRRFPKKKVLAIGFSMSANALLLLMSRVVPPAQIFNPADFEQNQAQLDLSLPDAAITVNAPIHLEKSARQLSQSLNRLYEINFMTNLHFLLKKLEREGHLQPTRGVHPLMKVSAFDDLFTAPRSGFASGLDYYTICSAKTYLQKIDRPTACLTAANDPFVDYQEYLRAPLPPMVRLHIEREGGHMGYLHKEKTPLGNHRWLDYGVFEIGQTLMSEN